ncbi:MAG: hypothetical protein JWL59_4155 [Chthoniobacteraceae bacterium]|nr:hypothetical protein [Chthoniobacteraceae bacterium]
MSTAWLESLVETVPVYLRRIQVADQPGRYLPCERGSTPVGREMALGFSCFALKLEWMLNRWESVPERERWVEFIQSFQDEEGAFIDPPQIEYLRTHRPWRERAAALLGRKPATDFTHSVMLAETKQAITTLAEVGVTTRRPFRKYPCTPESVLAWLKAKDWSRPWGAGGQSAGLIVFLKTQSPAFLAPRDVEELLNVCRDFYSGLADPVTGAYFKGKTPAHGEMVNGAMKVLMALDWLDVEPHYADRLVSTCLKQVPTADGCHLIDAIYVIHQCLRGEPSAETRRFCMSVLEMIKLHAHADGGFSFSLRKAQTHYYGVQISKGLDESDIQGTCLLVWALAMIWKILDPAGAPWRTLKP